jgi:hypothetical protein
MGKNTLTAPPLRGGGHCEAMTGGDNPSSIYPPRSLTLAAPPQGGGKPLVLLFFDGYDLSARPGFFGGLQSKAHYWLRTTKRSLKKQQVHTGFYTAFRALVHSLRVIGCEVRVNDFVTALKHPDYPIGVAGYPSVNKLGLPNPRIFGPGDFGTPPQSAALAQDPRFVKLIQPSDWFASLYRPYCGDKIMTWFAGIDTQLWPDLSTAAKRYDFLIYDKISFNREQQLAPVLGRVKKHLEAQHHPYHVVRYGEHHHSAFVQALKDSKAMIFLSQHETQGIAAQEAMAMNIPLLAWDEGEFCDPTLRQYVTAETCVSSVPYFDERCGKRFKINDFETVCDAFWQRHKSFTPREYVTESLSPEASAKTYLDAYMRIVHKD